MEKRVRGNAKQCVIVIPRHAVPVSTRPTLIKLAQLIISLPQLCKIQNLQLPTRGGFGLASRKDSVLTRPGHVQNVIAFHLESSEKMLCGTEKLHLSFHIHHFQPRPEMRLWCRKWYSILHLPPSPFPARNVSPAVLFSGTKILFRILSSTTIKKNYLGTATGSGDMARRLLEGGGGWRMLPHMDQ